MLALFEHPPCRRRTAREILRLWACTRPTDTWDDRLGSSCHMLGRHPVGDTRSSTSRGSPSPSPAAKTQQSTSLGDPPPPTRQPQQGRKWFFFFSYPPSLIKASSLGCQATEQRDQLIPESVRICPTEKHQPVYSALTRTIKSLNFIGLARHRNQDFYMDPTRPFSWFDVCDVTHFRFYI